MNTFLGVDGGGTKTEFILIDERGRVLARHQEGSAYYLEIGLDPLQLILAGGIGAVLRQAAVEPSQLTFAFFGLPAYGEDSRLLERLNAAASPTLVRAQYRCGNDMVCAWAGALGCRDGINIVAGTGSIGYGEFAGRTARAGGWGELFGDEGSAYWLARAGLNLFSRMSDGRIPRGPLYNLLRRHFGVDTDLDVCAAVNGEHSTQRSKVAQLAVVIAEAARSGDAQARSLFRSGALELVAIVDATREQLDVPSGLSLPVSYSGGMFKLTDLVLDPFQAGLHDSVRTYQCVAPLLPPAAGAALYAAKCNGTPLLDGAIANLQASTLVATGCTFR